MAKTLTHSGNTKGLWTSTRNLIWANFHSGSTGTNCSFQRSKYRRAIDQSCTSRGLTTPISDTNLFVKLDKSFGQQLQNSDEVFSDQNQMMLQEKMKVSADLILSLFPDRVSLQLTDEGSIFYTAKKDDYVIYLQHYLIDEFDGSDEAIVSVYNGNVSICNYGGELQDAISKVFQILDPESILLPAVI